MFDDYKTLEKKLVSNGFKMERTGADRGMCHFSREVEDERFTYYQEITVVESLPHFDTEWVDVIQFSKKTGERISSYPVQTAKILN